MPCRFDAGCGGQIDGDDQKRGHHDWSRRENMLLRWQLWKIRRSCGLSFGNQTISGKTAALPINNVAVKLDMKNYADWWNSSRSQEKPGSARGKIQLWLAGNLWRLEEVRTYSIRLSRCCASNSSPLRWQIIASDWHCAAPFCFAAQQRVISIWDKT